MHKLLRYFSIASFISIVLIGVSLGAFYWKISVKDFITSGEDKNFALTQAFANSLWPTYAPFLTSISGMSGDQIRAHPITPQLQRSVKKQMEGLLVVKVKIYNLEGLTVFSTDSSQIGMDKSMNPGFLSARTGKPSSSLTHRGKMYSFEGTIPNRDILSTYIPLRRDGSSAPVEGVFELYYDMTSLMRKITQAQNKLITGVLIFSGLLCIILFFIMKPIDRILKRQENERKYFENNHMRRREKVLYFQNLLLQLGKMQYPDLPAALKNITETASKVLTIERAGVWFFSEDQSEIICEDLYLRAENLHGKDMCLSVKDFPNYFLAMENNRILAVDDAAIDYRTHEFTEAYLKPLGITSMLDVPIRYQGKNVGMLCLEHTGQKREWTLEEQDFVVSISDIVLLEIESFARKKAEKILEDQAIRDPLTGLFNRRMLNARIEEEIQRADRDKKCVGVLMCDLDHFKSLNDTNGHHMGDEILKEVTLCITNSIRGIDLVFRWGGDEFIVVLSSPSREGILIVADRIRRSVHSLTIKYHFPLDMSIGIGLYPNHGVTPEVLIRTADAGLYKAKKGGDKIHVGDENYTLDDQSIKVVFQPIIKDQPNQVLGYEALSRDPQGKFSILDLFNRYQSIGQLQGLKALCFRTQFKEAISLGLKRVFINVDFNILNHLEIIPVPPEIEVILEISEQEVLLDIEKHLEITEKWRDQGYLLALDDFGAGFVSLPFIARLKPDYIKLDRSTVLQAASSKKFKKFTRDIVRAISIYTQRGIIAEGIETENECQVVRDLGINIFQGYLFGKPQELKKDDIEWVQLIPSSAPIS